MTDVYLLIKVTEPHGEYEDVACFEAEHVPVHGEDEL